VLHVGSKVAHGGEAESGDDRILHDVHVFVELPRLKAALEVNEAIAELEVSRDSMGKLPARARDQLPRCIA
jgi:hypothetical protein